MIAVYLGNDLDKWRVDKSATIAIIYMEVRLFDWIRLTLSFMRSKTEHHGFTRG